VFTHLARNYIQAINEGSVPTIRTAWENVVELENQKAIAEAFQIYEQRCGPPFTHPASDASPSVLFFSFFSFF